MTDPEVLIVGVGTGAAFITSMVVAAMGSRPVLRILTIQSSRIGQLEPGPAEIVGTARVVGAPLPALDGSPLVARRREMSVHYINRQGKGSVSRVTQETAFVALEIVDESGACTVEMEQARVIGPAKAWSFSPEAFKEQQPDLYERLAVDGYPSPTRVHVDETYVADGSTVLVSGTASPDGTTTPADDYRDARRRMRIVAPEGGALIFSGWDEAGTRRRLMRPVLIALWLAALSLLIGGLVVGASYWVRSLAHL